jgi:hypothetical protein
VLDAFIIEEIRRREQEQDNQRPRLDIPLPEPKPARQNDRTEEDEAPQRGVIIIDYSVPQDIPA